MIVATASAPRRRVSSRALTLPRRCDRSYFSASSAPRCLYTSPDAAVYRSCGLNLRMPIPFPSAANAAREPPARADPLFAPNIPYSLLLERGRSAPDVSFRVSVSLVALPVYCTHRADRSFTPLHSYSTLSFSFRAYLCTPYRFSLPFGSHSLSGCSRSFHTFSYLWKCLLVFKNRRFRFDISYIIESEIKMIYKIRTKRLRVCTRVSIKMAFIFE